jgi:putative ABC transport system permease protein
MLGIPLKYNLRHLVVRWVGTAMTALGIALPTGVFCAVLALNNGLATALKETGDPQNIVFLRKSSLTETNSSVTRADAPILESLDAVARDKDNKPIASPEVIVLLNLQRLENNGSSNVAIRGTTAVGRSLRPYVKLVEGKWPGDGLTEVAVAKGIADRFENCHMGARLPLGKRDWRVVGIFDAGTTAYGSEVWADAPTLAGAFLREAWSSLWVRAKGGEADLRTAKSWLDSGAIPKDVALQVVAKEGEPPPKAPDPLQSLGLVDTSLVSRAGLDLLLAPRNDNQLKSFEAFTERDYFRKQTENGSPIAEIGKFIAIFMAIGAAFAVMNTMYAAVASRGREIAVLRAIGFRRRAILASFMVESMILALAGGAAGGLVSYVVNGVSTGTTNFATFSEITFAFRVNAGVLVRGFVFGASLGLIGGLLPAIRAARQPITTAMRAI